MRLSRIHDERAQGVIEFALLATILMLIFLGTVDFARFLYYATALRNAANAGAQVETSGGALNTNLAGTLYSAVADDYARQATICEGRPYVNLLPYPTAAGWDFCRACLDSSTTCANEDPCQDPGGLGVNLCGTGCAQDICICRPAGTCPATGSPTSGDQVTVTVGYKFVPISPLMQGFFPTKSCFSGDSTSSNKHTLCFTATGRVY